jgi:hypothetical protein
MVCAGALHLLPTPLNGPRPVGVDLDVAPPDTRSGAVQSGTSRRLAADRRGLHLRRRLPVLLQDHRAKIFALDATRATPAERLNDGRDFVPTNKWIVFGHHFAAISGPGPLVGPTLAAQFGYLPGTLWIIVGVVLGGAVQDFVILASMRRDGKSLGQMARRRSGRSPASPRCGGAAAS